MGEMLRARRCAALVGKIAIIVGALGCIAQLVVGPIRNAGSAATASPPTANAVPSSAEQPTRLPVRQLPATELIAHATLAPPPAHPRESSADFPDPFVLRTRWHYVAYATNNRDGNVPLRRSADLHTWTPAGDALPNLPPWAVAGGTWAPSVLPVGSSYVMYVTLHTTTGHECVATATSANPLGPFHVDPDITRACIVWDAIDPSPFIDGDGSGWLLYKVDVDQNRIESRRLAPDGLHLAGNPVILLEPALSWEGGNVEGPSLARRDGILFLLFSANDYRASRYTIGWATCSTPAGPCQANEQPFLGSGPESDGPGGAEWVRDGTRATAKVAFAAWQPDTNAARPVRALHVIDTRVHHN